MLVLPTSSSGATGPAAIRVQSAALSAPQTLMMSSHPRISVEAGSTGCAGRSSAFEMPSNSGKPARTAMHRYPSFCIVANSAVDDRYTYNQELSMPSSTEGDQRTFMQLAPPPGSFLHSSLCRYTHQYNLPHCIQASHLIRVSLAIEGDVAFYRCRIWRYSS